MIQEILVSNENQITDPDYEKHESYEEIGGIRVKIYTTGDKKVDQSGKESTEVIWYCDTDTKKHGSISVMGDSKSEVKRRMRDAIKRENKDCKLI